MKIIATSHRYERIRPPDARDSDKILSPVQRSHSKTWKERGYILIIITRHSRKCDATKIVYTIGGDFEPH